MRKTLYECLKPELKEGLEKNRGKYSSSVKSVIATLESNSFYSDLKISQISAIACFTDVSKCDYEWNSHDWKYGEKLFDGLYST